MQTETATTFQTVARELAAAFETATRANGETFCRLSATAADWITGDDDPYALSVTGRAHSSLDDRLPCDWVYDIARRAADWAVEFPNVDDARESAHSFAAGCVGEYSYTDLFDWVKYGHNRSLCDCAVAEYGQPGDGFDESTVARWAAGGQCYGAERIAHSILDSIDGELRRRDA